VQPAQEHLVQQTYGESSLPDLSYPTFARTLPTKVWWDWSTQAKTLKNLPRISGSGAYDKMKGDFKWAKDVIPTYLWFNGSVERHLLGEKIDPSKPPVHHNYPLGKRERRVRRSGRSR